MVDEKRERQNHSCCEVPESIDFSICRECGKRGKSVKDKTLKSMVKEGKLESIEHFNGFHFCDTPTCEVVYFNNKQQVYWHKEDVRVRVGIKETEDPIQVCYCFGWTREKIWNQIKLSGNSTAVQEISARVKAKECACEINNPSGRCCLGDVNNVVKKGMELYGGNKGVGQKEGKWRNLPIIGFIISAMAASLCCIGPVVLALLGVGGAGLFSRFVSFRPYFIGVTAILLGWAFYLTYRKKEVVCEDGSCKIIGAGKWNKVGLWLATGLAIFLIGFPYLKTSSRNSPGVRKGGEIVEVTIPVEGMTCSGCAFNVENAVRSLDGIILVDADYQEGKCYVEYEKGKVTIDEIAEAINKAGYKATQTLRLK